MAEPEDLLEQAQEIAHRDLFVITGGSADDRKAAGEKARGLIADALEIYRSAGDRVGEAKALRRLGYLESMAGQREDARRAFAKSLETARNAADRKGEAKALRGAGLAELWAERLDKARDALAESASIFVELEERENAAQMQSELARALAEAGDAEAAIRIYEEAHDNAVATGDMFTASHSLTSRAHIYQDIGAPERSDGLLDKALELLRGCGDTDMALLCMSNISLSFMNAGAWGRHEELQREIAELQEKAAQEAEQSDDPEKRIHALIDRANYRGRDRNGYREAREACEEALRIDAAAGGTDLRGHILSTAAMHEAHADNLERARGFYREAIDLFEERGELWKAGDDLVLWGQSESQAGNYDAALSIFDRALTIKRKVGEPQSEAFTLGQIAWVHQQQGRYDKSRAAFRAALDLYRKAGDRNGECLELRGLANLEVEAGDRERARRLYAEARRIHQEDGEWHGEGYTLRDWGDMERDAGNPDAAHDLYEEARNLFGGHGELRGEGEMLGRLGRTNLNRNPRSAARYYLEAAKRFKRIGFTDAFERAMKRHRQAGGRDELD